MWGLKKKEDGEILLYRHGQTGKYLVVRKLAGFYPVYERLVQIRHKNLCGCYETAYQAAQIIHRDIKPENVMVQADGSIKIIDFDAARIYRLYETKDTKMLGTIGYAAPEQYGEAQSDARTDIYAMGILLNVMLTGKHPSMYRQKGRLAPLLISVYRSILKSDINPYQN